MKTCSVCKISKPIDDYYTVKQRGRVRTQSQCKACQAIKDRSPRCRISRLRAQCRRFGMPCTITTEQYEELLTKPCHYCGKSLEESAGSSLDRIDRARGYEVDNVVPCCWLCNHTKGTTFNEQEMKDIGALFDKFRERRKQLGQDELRAPFGGKKPKPRTPKYWQEERQRKGMRGWDHLHENEK